MTHGERPPKGEREGLKPKLSRETLNEVVARKALELVQINDDGITITDMEDIFSDNGLKSETERQKAKIKKRALAVLASLEQTGLLWVRGSHYESRTSLLSQQFSDDHVKTHPFDREKVLTEEEIAELPEWLAELVRSNA